MVNLLPDCDVEDRGGRDNDARDVVDRERKRGPIDGGLSFSYYNVDPMWCVWLSKDSRQGVHLLHNEASQNSKPAIQILVDSRLNDNSPWKTTHGFPLAFG